MARLLFEMQGVRRRNGQLASGIGFVVYTDAAGTVLADISATAAATATSTATVVAATSMVTVADIDGLGLSSLRFYGPDDVDTLFLRCPTDTRLGVQELEANADERLDALEAGGGGSHPNLAVHDALGLATDAELSTHAADTTSIHGITDTTVLATTSGVASSIITHSAATDPHADRAYARAYADSVAQGLDVKLSVRVASTANLTLSGEQTIDGVLTSADRVLVKNQTAGATNGIYVSAAGAWSRATDADISAEVSPGSFTFVEEGTVNGGTGWVQATPDPVVLDTTALVFTQFSGGGTVLGGAGLLKTGNTLDVGAGTGITVAADTVGIASGGVTNTQVSASAGIAESKLALNFPTHAESHASRHAAAGADPLTGYVLTGDHTAAAHDTFGLATDAELTSHGAVTTSIHGVADTAQLLDAADLAGLYPVPPTIAGLEGWYAADKISGLADGGTVAAWPDLSGYGRDALQATAANKPTYQTGELNSLPVVRFDGSNDGLATAPFPAVLAQPTTVILVFRLAGTANGQQFYDGPGSDRQAVYLSGGQYVTWAGSNGPVGGAPNTNPHVLTSVYNGGSSIMRLDGVQIGAGDANSQGLGGLYIGSTQSFANGINGDIAELVVYSRALSATERQQLEWYFGLKWGITVTLSAFNPGDTPAAPALVQAIPAVANGIVVREPLTQAVIDAKAVGDILRLGPGSHYVPAVLTLVPGVTIEGVGNQYQDAGTGTVLVGSSGVDVFQLPASTSGGQTESFALRNMRIYGGRRGLASLSLGIYVHLDEVMFNDQSGASIYIEGQAEEWRLNRCGFFGGPYGFQAANVTAAANVFDKSTFLDCHFGGHTVNNVRIEKQLSNGVAFHSCIFNTASQHGIYLDGGIRGMLWTGCQTEGSGQAGKSWRAVGTATASSTSLTSVSAGTGTAPVNGDPLVVAGAGTGGVDHYTTISSGAGTATIVMANAAVTSAAAAKVTNASYDDISINASIAAPSELAWVQCLFGGEGTNGHLRYAIRHAGGGSAAYIEGNTGAVPIYDPNRTIRVVGGRPTVRRPGYETTAGQELYVPAFAPTITGAKAGNAALTSLLVELAKRGFITDSSSA